MKDEHVPTLVLASLLILAVFLGWMISAAKDADDRNNAPAVLQARLEAFKLCMSLLPAGPQQTRYNDWDEVVHECQRFADYNDGVTR